MRPEVLATHIGTTIRSLVDPLHRTLRDQQKEIHDLKRELAALTAVTERQTASLDALRDENKALGQLVVNTQRPKISLDPSHDGVKH